ncbi:hypothetical protein BJF78_06970 [Pseudonocardia sp. CNS-139]|nr:hypothetical protein BJF78_06970 [Pseudonocardia sp. CNS-139]
MSARSMIETPFSPHSVSSPTTETTPSFTKVVAHCTLLSGLFFPLHWMMLTWRPPIPPFSLMYCPAATAASRISGETASGLSSV